MLSENEETSMRSVKKSLIDECGCTCWCCMKEFEPNDLQGHHIVPVAQGGQTTKSNIALLCDECHKEKHRLIKSGKWKQYKKSMKKVIYNGKTFKSNYEEFLSLK